MRINLNQSTCIFVIIIVVSLVIIGCLPVLPEAQTAFQSPLPIPTQTPEYWLPTPPPPVRTPFPIPECHAQAVNYITKTHGLNSENLIAGNNITLEYDGYVSTPHEQWRTFPKIGQRVCYVGVYDFENHQSYEVALNEQWEAVDLQALIAQERAVTVQECGKFGPDLCERWDDLSEDEVIEAAIWLTDIDLGRLYDTVAMDYPAELQPVKGLPFDTGHDQYDEAFDRVDALMTEAYIEKTGPLITFLEGEGIEADYASITVPVVFVHLTKDTIRQLLERDDVTAIYMMVGEFKSQQDSATASQRVTAFWASGQTGNGIKVAVVEDNPIDFSNIYLDHANGGTGPTSLASYSDDELHPTRVAGVIAMRDHPDYQGMAPNVTLYSADAGDFSPQSNISTASDWAVNTKDIDILNASFGGGVPTYGFWTRYFDHLAWNKRRTVIAATGNDGGAILAPATGYNVIAVGAFDDKDDAEWANDTMWSNSNYQDAIGRIKPEVVAVGANICTTNLSANDVNCDSGEPARSGTSYSAPQVSGLAALLMQETGQKRKPELIKALIMASAVHNIEGDRHNSNQDGAGGIDAALAYHIANQGRYSSSTKKGGWDYRTLNNSSFDSNGYYHYTIPIAAGERVRIALAYNSHPDSSNPYNNDVLKSYLDLRVHQPAPNGNVIEGQHNSIVDSVRIVEFVAQKTGDYDVRIKKTFWGSSYEYIGIAWSKQATYLPDVKANVGGWQSTVYVRNDGVTANSAQIVFYDTAGNAQAPFTQNINPNAVWQLPLTSGWFAGTAIVSGSEDLSVMVTQRHLSGSTYRYAATAGVPSDKAADTVHISTVMRNYGGGFDTQFYVQNAGTQSANIKATYYNLSGTNVGSVTKTANANGQVIFDQEASDHSFLGSNFIGSAKVEVTSGGPIAVHHYQDHRTTASLYSVAGFTEGAKTIAMPSLFSNAWGAFSSSFSIKYLNTGAANTTLNFVPNGTGYSCNETRNFTVSLTEYLPTYSGSCNFPTASPGWFGSGKATSSKDLIGSVNINEVLPGSQAAGAYSAVGSDSQAIIFPYVPRKASGWSGSNLGSSNTDITLRYYTQSGSNAISPVTHTNVASGASVAYYLPNVTGLSNGNIYSIVATSTGEPLGGMINVVHDTGLNGDDFMSYTAIGR